MRTRSADVRLLGDNTNQPSVEDVHTPKLPSPPGTKTPPTVSGKRIGSARNISDLVPQRTGSEPIDALALSKALQFEQAGRQRERTPGESPKRKRQRVYGDRCVGMSKPITARTNAEKCRADSYPTGPAKTYNLAITFIMSTALLRHHTEHSSRPP